MRITEPRVWVPSAAVLLGLGLLGMLRALGVLDWPAALQLALAGATGAAVVVLGATLVRHGRQLRVLRGDLGRVRDSQRDLRGDIGSAMTELRAIREDDLPKLGTDVVQRVGKDQRRHVRQVTDHVSRQSRWNYDQHIAWQELHDFLRPAPFMPSLRGWAASPDVVRILVEAIRDRQPHLVVECGSGASSVWLGYALRRVGKGRLVALEHDERYASLSRDLVAAHELTDIVEVRHAPLTDWREETEGAGTAAGGAEQGGAAAAGPESQPWYDVAQLSDLKGIDLLFIDGPPGSTVAQARYPAGPVLLPRCSPTAMVVLDDTVRADEQAMGDRWLAADPELRRAEVEVEKGAHIFTWEH